MSVFLLSGGDPMFLEEFTIGELVTVIMLRDCEYPGEVVGHDGPSILVRVKLPDGISNPIRIKPSAVRHLADAY
jgi:hypothetical protein